MNQKIINTSQSDETPNFDRKTKESSILRNNITSRAAYILAVGGYEAFQEKFAGENNLVMTDSSGLPIPISETKGLEALTFTGPIEAILKLGLNPSDRVGAANKFLAFTTISGKTEFSKDIVTVLQGDRVIIVFEKWYFFGTFLKKEGAAYFFSRAGLISPDRNPEFLGEKCAIVGNAVSGEKMKIVVPRRKGAIDSAFYEGTATSFAILGRE